MSIPGTGLQPSEASPRARLRALQAAAAALAVHAGVLAYLAWRPMASPEAQVAAMEIELADYVPEPLPSLEEQIEARIEARIEAQVANRRADGTMERTEEAVQSGRMPSAKELAELERSVRAEARKELDAALSRTPANPDRSQSGAKQQREPLESYSGWDKQHAGEVTVRFVLPGREAVFLEVPSYRCREGGKVVVDITVDAAGKVVEAVLAGGQTAPTADLACVEREALRSAKASRFNRAAPGTGRAPGTLTYVFQSQGS